MTTGSETSAPAAAGFYEEALTEAERLRLPRARGVDGIDDEIALLRVRLLSYAQENPENLAMLMRGVGLLTRAVATRYRLSPKSQQDLMDSLIGVVEGVGAAWASGTTGWRGETMASERLHRTLRRFRKSGEPVGSSGRLPVGVDLGPGSTFEALLDQRMGSLEAAVGELKERVNGLIYLVVGAALVQVVLRLVL